ncbi:MAG: hypothetical protein V1847_02970 [Candidatus Diapherotrites archaeon]
MMFDLLLGVFILFLVLAVLASLWQQNWDSIEREEQVREQRFHAQQALDSLLRFSGTPSNWQNQNCTTGVALSNVSLLGLGYRDRVLDSKKLSCLFALLADWNASSPASYASAKSILQLEGFEFGLRVVQSGSDQNSGYMSKANTEVVVLQRVANVNGGDANVELRVFR